MCFFLFFYYASVHFAEFDMSVVLFVYIVYVTLLVKIMFRCDFAVRKGMQVIQLLPPQISQKTYCLQAELVR